MLILFFCSLIISILRGTEGNDREQIVQNTSCHQLGYTVTHPHPSHFAMICQGTTNSLLLVFSTSEEQLLVRIPSGILSVLVAGTAMIPKITVSLIWSS